MRVMWRVMRGVTLLGVCCCLLSSFPWLLDILSGGYAFSLALSSDTGLGRVFHSATSCWQLWIIYLRAYSDHWEPRGSRVS